MPKFITPVDITPGSNGSWTDTDITAHVGADAGSVALAIVRAVNTSTTNVRNAGIRANGSTDPIHRLANDSQTLFAVLVDANDVFELFRASNVDFYLEGYFTTSEAGGVTNAVDVTPGSQNSWLDVDISTDTGSDTAVGACLLLNNTSTGTRNIGFRPNGSTDTFDTQMGGGNRMLGAFISCDGSEIFEVRLSGGGNIFAYLTGWWTSGANYTLDNVNRADYSTATTGSYVDVAPTEVAAGDVAALVLMDPTDDAAYSFDLRAKGETASQVRDARDIASWIVSVDANGDFQQQIENVALDLYYEGHFDAAGVAPITGSGALSAQAAAIAGAGVSASVGSGTLASAAATITGTDQDGAAITGSVAGLLLDPGRLMQR